MLYFDIMGGCIPAVLIVTILQTPYKHDHNIIYFILIFSGVVREHSVKTPNAYYCYFHMEILYVDIYKFVSFWII